MPTDHQRKTLLQQVRPQGAPETEAPGNDHILGIRSVGKVVEKSLFRGGGRAGLIWGGLVCGH